MVYRHTALNFSLTQICLELGLAEPTARGYMSRARQVMALDAERRQADITLREARSLHVFNERPLERFDVEKSTTYSPDYQTVDIEAGETCFCSWSEKYIDAESGGSFFWYIWFGLKQRGAVGTLWLRDMGAALFMTSQCPRSSPTTTSSPP